MDDSYAFFFGFGTFAFAEFLAYHWSPDYYEWCSNGNNYLWIIAIIVVALICFSIIDKIMTPKKIVEEVSNE